MFRVAYVTIFSAFFGTVLGLIIASLSGLLPEFDPLMIIFIIGNMLLPILAAVLLFQFFKQIIRGRTPARLLMLQVFVMVGLFVAGLLIWFLFEMGLSGISLSKIETVYQSEFRGFVLPGLLSFAFIPVVERLIDRQLRKKR
ncbi:MAG: hypothetical protein EOO88_01210 [Pedobacter sp.]|nr:MAG: hypothetical protein EOO88_01210 [Pedobacter sp.]